MTLTAIQNSFIAGELSPSLYGRTDLAKWRNGASTMRNFFANYRGGASSRAGLAYVGMCKQSAPNIGGTATPYPPRDIPFQFNLNQGYVLEFGDQYMRIKYQGGYVIENAKAVANISNANPCVLNIISHGYSVGDWIFITGIGGLTELNGLTWVVNSVIDANNITLVDLFGNVVNSTNFPVPTAPGSASRIYTVVSPYAAVDLPYLKFTQSADTMSLTCVNTSTLTEYPPYDLERFGQTNWVFSAVSFATSISAPTGVSVSAQSSTTVSTWYSYVVTAIDAITGEESVASSAVSVENNDISVNAGSNTITWGPVAGAGSYNIYKATPSYSVQVPIGTLFGFMSSVLGTNATDTNITADFTKVPPVHNNPFARGIISQVSFTNNGTGYAQNTVGFTISTSTGSGFAGVPIVLASGIIGGFYITNGGQNYKTGDTITFTGAHTVLATATLVIGAQSGTYPGSVSYFQQRRVYASSLNAPDTYWMSQPGGYLNFDASTPTIDSDSITGAPWAQQVNGIQFMVPMPGGLVLLTGKGAWQLNGGTNAAITPSDQDATPQAYNGCNGTVPPITINYDILYVQAKGSIVRDLAYNFFVNIYTGTDMTVLSNHLFTDHQVVQWAWCEEPYKLVWCVRDDGILIGLTYLKEQDVYSWHRHDTNGLFMGVCSITEPPVDAAYFIVQRFIYPDNYAPNGVWAYYAERMDNRNWPTVEDAFCVDAGLSWPMTFPNATLTAASATGGANISAVNIIAGGQGYRFPVVTVNDPTGSGSGAEIGVGTNFFPNYNITSANVFNQGSGYAPGTQIIVTDSFEFFDNASGAILQPIITNNVTFTASASIFNVGMVGSVIRMGGGVATITSYISGTQVVANITTPITQTIPNDPNNTPAIAEAGDWSVTPTTTVVTGLNHLEGMTVAILADGSVVPNQTVVGGQVTLPIAASNIHVGLPYLPQLQSLYLDPTGAPETSQGKRKNVYAVTVRMEATRGIAVGTNQPDASTQPNYATVPWSNLKDIKERRASINAGVTQPLFTGDERILVPADWEVQGQIAVQQNYPLPANILAFIPEYQVGDTRG